MTVKRLHFGAGADDHITGTNAEGIFDIVWSGGGDDVVDLGKGQARVHAGEGDDTITAGPDARVEIFGGAGSDTYDLRAAGPSRVWTGQDPTGDEPKPEDRPGDVDTIRFGPSRGQIAHLEHNGPGTEVVARNVWIDRHHFIVDELFETELLHLRFERWRGDWIADKAVFGVADDVTLKLRFADPVRGAFDSNPIWTHLPDWQDDRRFDPTYAWGPDGEGFWFGLIE